MLDSIKVGDTLYSASRKNDGIEYSSIRIDKVNSCEPGYTFSVFWGDDSVSHSVSDEILKTFSLTKEISRVRFLNHLCYKLTKGLDKELDEKKKEIEHTKSSIRTFLIQEGVSLGVDCDKPLIIPKHEVIDCVIETPQFKDGKVSKMCRQRGIFYTATLKFVHSGWFTGHDVQFQDVESFNKSVVKLL
jgi:hypothetical protein